MQITIKGKDKPRNVPDALAKVLIARGLAYEVRAIEPEPAEKAEEISPRTGRPKRQYQRRDMKAEE